MQELRAAARPLIVPAAILALASLAVWLGPPLPPTLAGLRTLAPGALLGAAALLAWWFNRGRAFVIAASLLGAFAAHWFFSVPTIALVLLVPANALAALILGERGARYRLGYVWLSVLGIEALAVAWLAALDSSAGDPAAMPLAGRLAFAAAFAAAVWRAWPEFRPGPVGNAAALAAFFIAAQWAAAPGVYAAFMSASGLMLLVALLQESHHMAFRDPLTGLPARRALEERLRGLGSRYAIAMVDVDHFKKFNDTHGHDIGDQVLRLVAARLAEVGGGGVAYRYGGEEFSVLFPGAAVDEALPHLERLRASIEGYRMAVRAPDRPKSIEHGAKRRGEGGTEKRLSVTVSIGASAPDARLRSPAQVIRAADEALYRAKQAGRNRVST